MMQLATLLRLTAAESRDAFGDMGEDLTSTATLVGTRFRRMTTEA